MRKTEEEIFDLEYRKFKQPYYKSDTDLIASFKVPDILKQHPYIIPAMQTFAQQDNWVKVEDGLPDNDCTLLCWATEFDTPRTLRLVWLTDEDSRYYWWHEMDNDDMPLVMGDDTFPTHYQIINPPNYTPST